VAKLVRDKVPQILEDAGRNPEYREAMPENRKRWLLAKLREECNELIDDVNIENIADILEVVETVIREYDFNAHDVYGYKESKNKFTGSFNKFYILEDQQYNEYLKRIHKPYKT
jgi:predicted house-cleaning noncanonical NTP pyrophosphatase (MazG superfamily)